MFYNSSQSAKQQEKLHCSTPMPNELLITNSSPPIHVCEYLSIHVQTNIGPS